MDKFIPYIGLTYAPSARGNQAMDCWGLIVLLFKDIYDIHLPTYDNCSVAKDGFNSTGQFIQGTELYKECQTVGINEVIQEGDLLLINNLGYPTHIAMAVDNESMIHCFDKAGSVIESFRSRKWISRIAGIYRHPSLA